MLSQNSLRGVLTILPAYQCSYKVRSQAGIGNVTIANTKCVECMMAEKARLAILPLPWWMSLYLSGDWKISFDCYANAMGEVEKAPSSPVVEYAKCDGVEGKRTHAEGAKLIR
jgi:hypothetical protein